MPYLSWQRLLHTTVYENSPYFVYMDKQGKHAQTHSINDAKAACLVK